LVGVNETPLVGVKEPGGGKWAPFGGGKGAPWSIFCTPNLLPDALNWHLKS
jgi:hypothetical protein